MHERLVMGVSCVTNKPNVMPACSAKCLSAKTGNANVTNASMQIHCPYKSAKSGIEQEEIKLMCLFFRRI